MTATSNVGRLNVLAAIANEQRDASMIHRQGVVVHPRGGLTLGKPPSIKNAPSSKMVKRTTTYKRKPTVASALPASKTGRPSASDAKHNNNNSSTGTSPSKYLEGLFEKHGATQQIPKRATMGDFVKPSDDEVDAYNSAVRFVRGNDLEQLQRLYDQGQNLDACNRVGESLLMVACRRGHTAICEFLLRTVQVRIELRDDFGRTLLHDACWRPEPCKDLMDVLLQVVSPEWLLAQDVRGHTPFDYARREHWGIWIDYLKNKEDLITRRLSLISSSSLS